MDAKLMVLHTALRSQNGVWVWLDVWGTGWPSVPKAPAFEYKRTTGDPKAEAIETVYQVGFDQEEKKNQDPWALIEYETNRAGF